jgi:hypothetical protein
VPQPIPQPQPEPQPYPITPEPQPIEAKPIIYPPIITKKDVELQQKREEYRGALTFKHGNQWRAWKYPYEDDDEDIHSFWKYPPPEAVLVPNVKTAQGTLQLYLGKTPPPPDRIMHMGIVDFSIHSTPEGKLEIKATENREAAAGYDDMWNSHPRGAHTHKAKVTKTAANSSNEYSVGSV